MARRQRARRGEPGLVAMLRREARAGRPMFSGALHERVVAGIAAATPVPAAPAPVRSPRGHRRVPLGGLVVTGAVVVALVAAATGRRQAPPAATTADVALTAAAIGIERLPTPGEIGEGVLEEVTTLAAAAVGVAAWGDLAVIDPALFAGADGAGR